MPGIRSSPGFSKRGFEIHYPCKQGLRSNALVRVYTAICALDQVIENWSHLCKLCNNQEECGSVTPGCRKETSFVIRHKAGLEAAAAAAASNWKMGSWGGIWGDRLPLQDQRGWGWGTYTQGRHLKTCVFISHQPRLLLVSWKYFKTAVHTISTSWRQANGGDGGISRMRWRLPSLNACVVSYINNEYFKNRKITEEPLASQEVD